MKNPQESAENLLETEIGMFHLEMPRLEAEANEIIEISNVSDELKGKFRVVLGDLVAETLKEVKSPEDSAFGADPYDLSRSAVSRLIQLVDERDHEQNELFEAVKSVIWKTCYSAKKWKWPPETKI
ncbi:MAG: hypothetical protein WCT25_03025 [Candidatus Paceibacterota bacterium]